MNTNNNPLTDQQLDELIQQTFERQHIANDISNKQQPASQEQPVAESFYDSGAGQPHSLSVFPLCSCSSAGCSGRLSVSKSAHHLFI